MNAKVYCDGTRIRCLHEIKLTVSMSGAPVEFDFSSEWDGLGKTAVFTCDGTKDVILDAEGKAVVPHEILTTPGMDVVVGVYAVREDGTTWPAPTPLCRIGRVETGADPSGDESYPPTPDVGEQAVAAASKALEAAAEAQEVAADIQRRADAGEFDGKDGGYYTPAVTQPDDTTMRVNFTPSKAGMPTVLQQDIKLPKGSSVELDTTLTQSGKAADAKAVGDALAVYVLSLSTDEADAQANSDAVTAAIAEHKHVVLKAGKYPVKPGIVIESGKLDMNGAHFYTVDYKSNTPLVYMKGEAPEICNGELEGSYDLADDEEGYEFFESEMLIRPEGVNGAYIHHMDLHNNWGYCISPGENVERVYVETATRTGSNDWFFTTDEFNIPEGYKYVTAAGGIGYNYIISVNPVVYRFYDESGTQISKQSAVPRKRIAIPSGAKTVTFETALETDTFVTYYACFTNYEETLTVADCKLHNFHSLGMANFPGPTTVTRCSFIESGKPRSEANGTARATTGGIATEDVQTPEFIMSDCYSRDCAKMLMFGGYKGVISNCVGDKIGVYRGWQCDLSNCNINQFYTMGSRCRISMNGVHADLLDIEEANYDDVRGNISTNTTNPALKCFDSFAVKFNNAAETGGRISGRLNGIVRGISSTGFRWHGCAPEKGSRVVIDQTIIGNNGNFYGAMGAVADAYGLVSNAPFAPNGYTIHDSTFNIASICTAYSASNSGYNGGFKNCVFNLTGAAYFRKFTGTLTVPITLTFENCIINNADNYLFNFVPEAGGVVTFKNCTIADENKLFRGDASKMTVNVFSGGNNGVDIDASLSVEGAAADAKAVGDALAKASGNAWRQIADITLDEEIGNVNIAEDMDGKSFSLREFYVLVESKVPTTGTAFTSIKTNVNGETISNNAGNNDTSDIRHYYCYAKFIPGIGALCWHGVSKTLYNQSANMQQMLRPYSSLYQASGMSSLTICPNDGNNMLGGVGTTIKVWGVDA